MSSGSVAYKNIPSTYFGIDMSTFYKVGELFFGERYEMMTNNVVISKAKAVNIAFEELKDEITEYSELYISRDSIRVCDACDFMGKPIFKDENRALQGWLVFFNPYVFLNWEHPCKYMFIVNEKYIRKLDYNRPYQEETQMELIKQGD